MCGFVQAAKELEAMSIPFERTATPFSLRLALKGFYCYLEGVLFAFISLLKNPCGPRMGFDIELARAGQIRPVPP